MRVKIEREKKINGLRLASKWWYNRFLGVSLRCGPFVLLLFVK